MNRNRFNVLNNQKEREETMVRPENYTVIDLEMTGLSAKTDKVLEIGAVRVRNRKIEDTYGTLVNPHVLVGERITELTGITNEMALSGMEPDEAIQKLLDFIGEDVIVGQNVTFDYSFLKQWAVNHKIKLEMQAFDTLKIARKILPPEQPKNLEALCCYYKIRRQNAHRALDDALETKELFECLLEQVIAMGIEQLGQAQYESIFTPKLLQYKAKRQTPATKHQIERLQEYRKSHGITDEINWETLTRSEASRLQDQYYAKYGK